MRARGLQESRNPGGNKICLRTRCHVGVTKPLQLPGQTSIARGVSRVWGAQRTYVTQLESHVSAVEAGTVTARPGFSKPLFPKEHGYAAQGEQD